MNRDPNPFPYSELFEQSLGDVLSQELVTYIKNENGKVTKITVKRSFTGDDYTDAMTSEVIFVGNKK